MPSADLLGPACRDPEHSDPERLPERLKVALRAIAGLAAHVDDYDARTEIYTIVTPGRGAAAINAGDVRAVRDWIGGRRR